MRKNNTGDKILEAFCTAFPTLGGEYKSFLNGCMDAFAATDARLAFNKFESGYRAALTCKSIGEATSIKTGDAYLVMAENLINTTNAQDGQVMVEYTRDGKRFVREVSEFRKKFKEHQ